MPGGRTPSLWTSQGLRTGAVLRIVQGDCHDAALRRSDLSEPRHGAASRMCGPSGVHHGAPARRGARLNAVSRAAWEPVDRQALGRVHHRGYVDSVERFAAREGATSSGTRWPAASRFAWRCRRPGPSWMRRGAWCAAKTARRCAWSARPGITRCELSAMGFCLFNNVAIAARTGDRRAGAGSRADRRLGRASLQRHAGRPSGRMNRWACFPFIARRSIRARATKTKRVPAKGLGTTRNLPVAFGTPRREYVRGSPTNWRRSPTRSGRNWC